MLTDLPRTILKRPTSAGAASHNVTPAPKRVTFHNSFRAFHSAGVDTLLASAVGARSSDQYSAHWDHWVRFCSHYDDDFVPAVCLLQGRSESYKLRMICAFVHYLYTTVGHQASTVIQTMSGVRHGLRCHLQDLDIFKDPAVAACKQAISRADAARGVGLKKRKLPFTVDMVSDVLRHIPIRCKYDLMLATAVQLGFFGLFRAGELLADNRPRMICHALCNSDVLFQMRSGAFICFCDIHRYEFTKISTVKVTLRSAKNDQMRIGHSLWFPAHMSAPSGHINIARVLYEWSCASSPVPGAKLLSFRAKAELSTTYLSYNSLRNCIKACAKRFDFDPILFSVHSLRIGGASTLRAGGASDSMIQLLGRWSNYRSALGYMSGTLSEFVNMQQILANPTDLTASVVRILEVDPHVASVTDCDGSELDLTLDLHC